jgi:CheY-like chemotaxis protein
VVRNDPHWSGLPVLFLTVHTQAQTVEQIFAAGADDCISKPIVDSKLINRIFNRLKQKVRSYKTACLIYPMICGRTLPNSHAR